MNMRLLKSASAVLVAALLLTGCENMSPEANGAVFGTGAGILAGGLAAAVGASPAQAVAIGLAAGTVAGVTAYVVAKRKATERQRQYAEEGARLAYENASAERKAQFRKKRYIAVDTVREKDSVGAKSVMIYDLQTEQLVGDTVYDVKQSPKQGTVSKFDTYSADYVGNELPPSNALSQASSTPSTQSTLPTFFPPRATATVPLPLKISAEELSLGQLSDRIGKAMDEAGYERRSYFWLDKEYAPGFAIVTHIEQIHPDGTPVSKGRWSFDLPSYESFSIPTFLKWLIKADPGNYRMIALVVSKVQFKEKNEPMTQAQSKVLSEGPTYLAKTTDSQVTVTEDYHCTAYVYEFDRKTRNDDPEFKASSDVSASAHLKSTPLWNALAQIR